MLISFAAAIEGGVALDSQLTSSQKDTKSEKSSVGGAMGLSKLFSSFVEAKLDANMGGEISGENSEVRSESRRHTESSLAILLYNKLDKQGALFCPKTIDELISSQPGSLIELGGRLSKNPVDASIDMVHAVHLLSGLGEESVSNSAKSGKSEAPKKAPSRLESIHRALDDDRRRTPISNILLECHSPFHATSIVSLRKSNLRDLTLSELHGNYARVVGKVIRSVSADERVCVFENYGMGLMKESVVANLFATLSTSANLQEKFSDTHIQGPTVLILPLMVYV